MTERPAVGAAVDLGSNSVHLLVAAIAGHALRPIVDESAFLGLGAAVDATSHLGRATTERLLDTLQGYAATARSLGAQRVTLLGTDPLRRAADAARVAALVEERTGVPLHVLSHEEEGYLMLVGVTDGQPVTRETLVVDIGGGSSEFVAVGPGSTARAAGLRLGSNGLTRRVDPADPPTMADVERLRALARESMTEALDDAPEHVLAVGGTATNLLKVTAGGTGDPRLTPSRLAEALDTLTAHPAATITERFVVNPVRARLLAAGAAIVEAVLERYGVPELTVSEAGLREGAIHVADHAGLAWRDRLPELAHGWRV